jgi:hypothetical protein
MDLLCARGEGREKNTKKERQKMPLLQRGKLLLVLVFALLTGCGGGGSDPGTAPIANMNSSGTTPAPQGGTPPASEQPQNPPPVTAPPKDPPPDNPPPDNPPPDNPPPPQVNAIQLENRKTSAQGATNEWEIPDSLYASNREIEGYASATSVNRGGSIRLYVNTVDPSYTISIYRMGWYGGQGGRLVAPPVRRTGIRQPAPRFDASTRLVECDWTDPYVLAIPENRDDPTDWASGIYLAKLTGSSGKQSYIIFVVRDDSRNSAILFQSSVTTYAAYNNWGGYNFYPDYSAGNTAAHKLSFNRPYRNEQIRLNGKGAGDFFEWEINMLRFVEREGFDVTYSTNIDTDAAPGRLLAHRGFLSVGHDEYWTKNVRDGLESARDNGVNLAFIGANTGYWQIRLEPGANGDARRTVVGYKYDTAAEDPLFETDPAVATTLWRDAPVNRPEASLIGVMYDYNSLDLDMVIANCPNWICAGTGIRSGSVLAGMLGYEVDRVDASSPAGIAVIGASPYEVCRNPDCTEKDLRYANMTYYNAPSGAGVFATGSMNWNWGVDDYGPNGYRVNPAVQGMTRNVLRRFVGP